MSFGLSIITLLLAQPSLRLILIGGAISFMGVGLRAWASGHLRKNEVLTITGPYRYTRNPLYLGSFLIGLGVMIAGSNLVLLGLFLVFFAAVFGSAMIGEAGHLRTLFPEQYSQYERAVPLFFPRLKPYTVQPAQSEFSFRRYQSRREYRVALGVIVALALLFLKAQWAGAAIARGQHQPNSGPGTRTLIHPLPFAEGERLTYKVRFSKLFISGTVGRLAFTFDRSSEKPLTDHHLIKAEVVSDGFLTKLVRVKAHYVFESFVDRDDFGVARTRKTIQEGRKNKFELAVFDRDKSEVLFVQRDLKNPSSPPKVERVEARPWVQDIVSALYYVRAQPLSVGQTLRFPMSDSGRTYDVDVNILSQEQMKIDLRTYDTVKVQPLIFGQERPIRKDGEMYVWLTNDARRLPVRIWVRGSFGTANIELKDVK
jgi:hypothetical protein